MSQLLVTGITGNKGGKVRGYSVPLYFHPTLIEPSAGEVEAKILGQTEGKRLAHNSIEQLSIAGSHEDGQGTYGCLIIRVPTHGFTSKNRENSDTLLRMRIYKSKQESKK